MIYRYAIKLILEINMKQTTTHNLKQKVIHTAIIIKILKSKEVETVLFLGKIILI